MKRILITGGQGYIGSELTRYLSPKYEVHAVDLGIFGTHVHYPPPGKTNFNTLPEKINFEKFDAVIHLAGHSSVAWCDNDPVGSLKNNCVDFFRLEQAIPKGVKFIYASSASVYGRTLEPVNERYFLGAPLQEYDRQKQLIDMYMSTSKTHYYGLRFGTVCGHSRNPRNELLINAMVKSGREKGRIFVRNPQAKRAVLAMVDLCRSLWQIIENDYADPGFYNLASFNSTVGDLAMTIASQNSWSVEELEGGTQYSFEMDTSKFESVFDSPFRETVYSTIAEAFRNNIQVEDRKWTQQIS